MDFSIWCELIATLPSPYCQFPNPNSHFLPDFLKAKGALHRAQFEQKETLGQWLPDLAEYLTHLRGLLKIHVPGPHPWRLTGSPNG